MIDILLSTYNGEKFLAELLDSILEQTYHDFKIIIRDDGSSDNTPNIVSDYKIRFPDKIQILKDKKENFGSTKSFFKLLHSSSAELVMFCDQDDVWNYNKLDLFVRFYEVQCKNLQKPVLIHSAVTVVSENLTEVSDLTVKFNSKKCGMGHSLIWQIFQNDVTGCTVMINSAMRDIVNKIDFSQCKIIQHDWLLAQIAHLNNSKFYLPEKTVKYRQHEKNVVGAKHIGLLKNIKMKIKKGISYKYYDQIGALLQCEYIENSDTYNLLFEFADLKNKNKLSRIFWHIQHKFFREGNILYKLYQLFAC